MHFRKTLKLDTAITRARIEELFRFFIDVVDCITFVRLSVRVIVTVTVEFAFGVIFSL